jgi:hypothetical protein
MAMVLALTVVHEVILIIFPTWYSIIVNFRMERQMINSSAPSDLAEVMTGEALFVGLFIVSLFAGRKRKTQASQQPVLIRRTEMITFAVIVTLGMWASIYTLTTPITTLAKSATHAEVRTEYSSVFEMLSFWCLNNFYLTAICAAPFLLLVRRVWPPLRLIGAAMLASVVVFGAMSGVRGRMTWALLAWLAVSGLLRHRKAMVMACLFMVALVPLFVVLSDATFRFALHSKFGGQSQRQALPLLEEQVSSSLPKLTLLSIVDPLMERAMGPRDSIALFQFFDGGEGASYRPILSAIYLPIPRVLWTSKPPAGSADSTPYGGAMYRVMRYSYGAAQYVMGPFLASAHAYWEGGWPWLVLTGIGTGVIWRVILWWCSRQSLAFGALVAVLFAGAFLLDGFYTMLAPTFELIRALWLSVLPAICLRWIVTLFSGLRPVLNHRPARSQLSRSPAYAARHRAVSAERRIRPSEPCSSSD